jgi:hypothetical protein
MILRTLRAERGSKMARISPISLVITMVILCGTVCAAKEDSEKTIVPILTFLVSDKAGQQLLVTMRDAQSILTCEFTSRGVPKEIGPYYFDFTVEMESTPENLARRVFEPSGVARLFSYALKLDANGRWVELRITPRSKTYCDENRTFTLDFADMVTVEGLPLRDLDGNTSFGFEFDS